MKLCIDCKHYRVDDDVTGSSLCGHPVAASLVDGRVFLPCAMARQIAGKCDRGGKLWEPKHGSPKPVPFLKRLSRWIGRRFVWTWRTR